MSPVDDWFLFPQAWPAASIRPRCVHALFLSAGQPATTAVPSGGRGCFCLTRWIGFVATVVLGMLLAAESARAASVRIRLEVTDLSSNVVANVNVGESFLLRGFVTDLRADPKGVFSSYLDVGYSPAAAVIPTGGVTFTFQVQTLTHLTNGWQNVGSAVSLGAAGTAELLDASATNHPIRFYRAYPP